MYGFKNREHVETLKEVAIERRTASDHGTAPGAVHASGPRIFIVRPTAAIPAFANELPGSGTVEIYHHSWQTGDTDEPTGTLEVYEYDNGDAVTRTGYNLAPDELAADCYYIAVEDAWGKLLIISSTSAPAATHIVTASGDVFGMGYDQPSQLAIYATDLSVSSDTVHVYRTVATESEQEQTGGNDT